ncbi:MAG: hypothetical protein AAFX85_15885 [Pseudomonadota bacterium]
MSDEYDRDPLLMQLFHAASDAPAAEVDEPFVERVMARLERRQRRAWALRLVVGVALAIIAIPLQDPLELLADYLLSPLIDAQSGFGRVFFSPMSSVGAVLSVVLLGVQWLLRRRER